jgi:hypothetical protein
VHQRDVITVDPIMKRRARYGKGTLLAADGLPQPEAPHMTSNIWTIPATGAAFAYVLATVFL